MESVPETERLEEFKSSPRPSLRLQSPSTPSKLAGSALGPVSPFALEPAKRPGNLRRSTDPTDSPRSSSIWSQMQNQSQSSVAMSSVSYRPRNASPLTLGAPTKSSRQALINHGRSKSHSVGMSRTQSLPGVNGSGHLLFSPNLPPASLTTSPQRVRVPRRNPDDCFPTSPIRTSVLENSPRRNRDRSNSPSASISGSYGPSSSLPSLNSAQVFGTSPLGSSPLASFPLAAAAQISVSKVRPSSPPRSHPFVSLMSSPMSLGRNSLDSNINLSTGTSSISTGFSNYTYSTNFSNTSIPSLAASSVPSTPTSVRSRSPSLSSLETIEDTPDAEEAAVEEDIKAAAEVALKGESDVKPIEKIRGGRGFRDKRKRWSVCGAERRGDLDLETIWED